MINELQELSKALEKFNVQTTSWHRKYIPIPRISKNNPCIKITLNDGNISQISAIPKEFDGVLHKYGTNQGTYPCMNLPPLYLGDQQAKKFINGLKPEDFNSENIKKIKSFCVTSNWDGKVINKYKICMQKTTNELKNLLKNNAYLPLLTLIDETDYFLDHKKLHQEIERSIFDMLTDKDNIQIALKLLFQFDDTKRKENSIAFESTKLIDTGTPAVSEIFVKELNKSLLDAEQNKQKIQTENQIDAFGIKFCTDDDPMPTVKLAGGFEVSLRTMFDAHSCQYRYGKIKNESYPLSTCLRTKFQANLNWLGSEENKDSSWITTDKNEILFAYPFNFYKAKNGAVKVLKRYQKIDDTKPLSFIDTAELFIDEIKQQRKDNTNLHSELIQIFILRKIDKARTKIVYTKLTNAFEIEQCCKEWDKSCKDNIPNFPFGKPFVPFPLEFAEILNTLWKQNGEKFSVDKFKPVPKFHGLNILLEPCTPILNDLHLLVEQGTTLSAFLGKKAVLKEFKHPTWVSAKKILIVMGMLLYRLQIKKETYMEDFPYLCGQLLKISDELHALYCSVVRNNDIPPQLVGGGMYQAVLESPIRSLNVLGQRMNPYINWAKYYRYKNVQEKNKESWRASWLLALYEKTADKLYAAWNEDHRFNDVEKAQFFIGYLASLSGLKKDKEENSPINQKEDEIINE